MSVRKWVVGFFVLSTMLTQDVSAQDKGVTFQIRGGRYNGVADLNDAGTHALQERGWNAGAGIQFDANRFIALRGDVNLARNGLKINDAETGDELSRLFYDAAIQFTYPIQDFKPYVFVGAGGVKLHPAGSEDGDKTTVAATGGLGVSYTIPGTNLAFGVEGKSWLYDLKDVGGPFSSYDKMQFDATWGATISYRIPLGTQVVRASR